LKNAFAYITLKQSQWFHQLQKADENISLALSWTFNCRLQTFAGRLQAAVPKHIADNLHKFF